jgi:hypothetical protein
MEGNVNKGLLGSAQVRSDLDCGHHCVGVHCVGVHSKILTQGAALPISDAKYETERVRFQFPILRHSSWSA